MLTIDKIHIMDCLTGLRQMPDNAVQCCVTSPPYWRQRDYGMPEQFGMEDTPEQYVKKLVELFTEVKRVLKPNGTLWLNLGDGYWGSGKAGSNPEYHDRHKVFNKPAKEKSTFGKPTTGKHAILKPKDLIGFPWKVAFALQQSGWWLRQDIIWYKLNGMPESTTDRCTRCHEYIFMLSKSQRYYYDADAIKTNVKLSTVIRMQNAKSSENKHVSGIPGQKRVQQIFLPREKKQDGHGNRHAGFNARWNKSPYPNGKVNKRSVWTINCKPLKEKHFAAFPPLIPEICIKAGSKEGDIILDPFMGSGTTALVAALQNRHFIGFELNPAYVDMAHRRLQKKLGLFFQMK